MITRETIDLIRETARIDEVVGDFVLLKRRGVNLLGNCPFHDERTPSFTVSPTKGIYKCFGCGASGDSVKFVMEHEHFTYPEALKYLAKKYNIAVEETEPSPEEKLEIDQRESLYAVNAFAEGYFVENLWENPRGKAVGLSYFHERGFSDETIHKFKLGFALEDWDHLLKTAREKGYKDEYLKKLGLVSSGERTVDIYRGRVMFPIHNLSGRVLGFGGRILKTQEKAPKYINSPESDIYNKSQILYGMYFAKKAILQHDTCYLVEGYTDVISMHQAGVENVVASSGTSLTTGQIKLIGRFTKQVTILYDGDFAGIKASFRGINMILEEGLNVKVVLFPDGEDPDSYARTHGGEALRTFLKAEEKDFIQFKTSVLLKEVGNDPLKRAGVIRDIVESIALIPDGIVRSVFIQQCSTLLQVEEHILIGELNKILRERVKKKIREKEGADAYVPADEQEPVPAQELPVVVRTSIPQETEVIRLLVNYAGEIVRHEVPDDTGTLLVYEIPVAQLIVHEIMDEIEFEQPLYQQIVSIANDLVQDGKAGELNAFLKNHEEDTIRNAVFDLMAERYELSKNWEERFKIYTETEDKFLYKSVMRAIFGLRMSALSRMVSKLEQQMKATESIDEIMVLIEQKKNFDLIRVELARALSRVIVH